jgi:tetratricopeptide (TPR) repeat protein
MTDPTEMSKAPELSSPGEGTAPVLSTKSAVARRSGPRKLVTAGVALLILAGLLAAYFWRGRTVIQPPLVNLQGVEPAVVAAIGESRASVLRSPNSADAWGRLGMVLLAHQFREDARVCFAQAEQLNPREVRWPYFQALILTREDLEAATLKLRRAVQLSQGKPDAPRLRLAEALLVQGQGPEAKTQFEQLLAQDPSHPGARLGLARLAFEQGEWQQSLDHLQYAKSCPFTRKAAHSLLATVYQRLGDQAAASGALRASAALPDDPVWPDPLNAEVGQLAVDRGSRLGKAVQLRNQGRDYEAITALNQLIADDPDWDLSWQCLGHILLEQRAYAQAEKAMSTALQLAPTSAEAHFYMGRVLMEQGQQTGALAEFRRARELKPTNAMMHYQVGHYLALKQDRPGAIEALTEAVRYQPDLAPAHKELASLLLQEGRKPDALIHLRRALELSPEDDSLKNQLRDIEAGR